MRESAVVADATVLIFLGKLRRLDWLRETYDRVLIPSAVYEEVVERGEITFEEFIGLLETLLEEGFYLDESIYLKAVRKARQLGE